MKTDRRGRLPSLVALRFSARNRSIRMVTITRNVKRLSKFSLNGRFQPNGRLKPNERFPD